MIIESDVFMDSWNFDKTYQGLREKVRTTLNLGNRPFRLYGVVLYQYYVDGNEWQPALGGSLEAMREWVKDRPNMQFKFKIKIVR
ncbi:hypothetical protein GPK34_00370 [Secundilactobacillus kimchicus]|uniref:hypothetical protein n=1 Tax=Secundilactobacillus kimchicus TaxID=528209 RepID=UPI001C00DC11|nr:hypothetical protein [Secundilactobacillus kimchicus]MBT9670491.1 hypothetical protein [Secundilactobacillus kimchicus]